MGKNSEIIKYSSIILVIMFSVLIITIYWNGFFSNSTIVIDPEYYSGLIGAISIAFSMLLWVFSKEKSHEGLTTLIILAGIFFLIMGSVGNVLEVARGKGNPEATIYFLVFTLMVIFVCMMAFLVIKHFKAMDEEGKTISEL